MRELKKTTGLILVSVLMLITSCTSTKVLSSWSLPNPPANTMKKVLVIATLRDAEAREKMERTMVHEFVKFGIEATSSTDVFGKKGFTGLKEEDIVSKLKNSSYTSVMIIALLDKERENVYYPGSRYAYPYYPYGYNRFYRRYMVINDYIYTPVYTTSNLNFIFGADIYTIEGDELVYSAQTKSYDPSTKSTLAEDFASSIASELKSKGLIP